MIRLSPGIQINRFMEEEFFTHQSNPESTLSDGPLFWVNSGYNNILHG